jgi:hypothetical protein
VIYVMGAGRSGSTTLGITLGNCPDVFYAGELDNWLARSGTPQVEDPERTRFWRSVRDELDDPEGAAALFGNLAQRSIERSLALARVHLWPKRLRLRRRYRAVAEDLYRAVVRAAGARIIIDTSHYPLRARELQRARGLDMYLVFLVRDPQGVVASFKRQDVHEFTKSTIHTNSYLLVTHLLSLIVFLRHPRGRRLFVRYEHFVTDPAGVVTEILRVAGLPDATTPDFTALEIGSPLQGNRVTRRRTISLNNVLEPVSRPSHLTTVMQAPMKLLLAGMRPAAQPSQPPHRASSQTPL